MHAQIYLIILIGLILAIILFMTGKFNQLNKILEKHLKESKGNAPDLPAESNWYIANGNILIGHIGKHRD